MTFTIRSRRNPVEHEDVIGGVIETGFDGKMKALFTRLLMGVVSQALAHCFSRYTEADYHSRMAQGFSFIDDWRTNHTAKFNTFIKRARRAKNFLKLDEYDILKRVDKIMTDNGWTIYESEKSQILKDIQEIKRLIES